MVPWRRSTTARLSSTARPRRSAGVAKVDASIRRGAVSVPHGHHAANVNLLTDKDDIDTVTGMVRYAGVAVRVSTP